MEADIEMREEDPTVPGVKVYSYTQAGLAGHGEEGQEVRVEFVWDGHIPALCRLSGPGEGAGEGEVFDDGTIGVMDGQGNEEHLEA